MIPPDIRLSELPTRTDLLHAAITADNYADQLKIEELRWRTKARDLFREADARRNETHLIRGEE